MIVNNNARQKSSAATIFAKYLTLSEAKQNQLWLGWKDTQVEKVQIEMGWREHSLGPVLAAVACSLVAEAVTTSNPVRYSRSKNWYAFFSKHIDEPAMAWRKILPAMDMLIEQGWANGVLGIYAPHGQGKQSIAWATPALVERLTPLVVLEHRRTPEPNDVLILRDKDRRHMPILDNEATRRMRSDLEALNAAYASHQWYLRGRQLEMPTMRRIFNGDLHRGGRGYHQGRSYQQLSHEEREQIMIDINGVMWPTKEVDYRTLHIRLAYAQAGVPMSTGDAYDVHGFDRNREVKPALNTLLNATTEKEALGVIGGKLLDRDWNRGRELIAALKSKHPALVPYFGSDAGARFQRMDSDMAITVALAVLRRTGRPPLIVHDSFIVAVQDQDVVAREMDSALHASLSPSSSAPSDKVLARPIQGPDKSLSPSSLSIWSTTPPEQGEEEAWKKADSSHPHHRDGPPQLTADTRADLIRRLQERDA